MTTHPIFIHGHVFEILVSESEGFSYHAAIFFHGRQVCDGRISFEFDTDWQSLTGVRGLTLLVRELIRHVSIRLALPLADPLEGERPFPPA
jgi:hypothetical protein